jgi:hypothetical protein
LIANILLFIIRIQKKYNMKKDEKIEKFYKLEEVLGE